MILNILKHHIIDNIYNQLYNYMPEKLQNKKVKKTSKKSSKQIRQKRMKYKPDFYISPPKFIMLKK